ncbi:hypothetical protein FQV26_07655 [Planococcus sp. CPCC 101016]|uniref:hypothetical protein n=1 Tax=Planococcus sp. CPCC 101016 TaxID=2599617 RepID=UPI0011B7EFE2|nr:hypothetical protein [Planococcus sp. CPCC 101016]TWT07681.1 hypothetical protein FQV26_07655 [Planococcus sp. CPCC 101016]
MSMQLETIKNLLQISLTFNTSFITHSFAIGEEDGLHVKCLRDPFVLEITCSKTQQREYYVSVDQAAEVIYERIYANN